MSGSPIVGCYCETSSLSTWIRDLATSKGMLTQQPRVPAVKPIPTWNPHLQVLHLTSKQAHSESRWVWETDIALPCARTRVYNLGSLEPSSSLCDRSQSRPVRFSPNLSTNRVFTMLKYPFLAIVPVMPLPRRPFLPNPSSLTIWRATLLTTTKLRKCLIWCSPTKLMAPRTGELCWTAT